MLPEFEHRIVSYPKKKFKNKKNPLPCIVKRIAWKILSQTAYKIAEHSKQVQGL